MDNELIDTVQELIKKVKRDQRITGLPLVYDATFERFYFWLQFCIASQKTASASSKITISYSKPPLPTSVEAKPLINELISSYESLFRTYLKLPRDQGVQFCEAVTWTLHSIQSSLLNFLTSFITAMKETRPILEMGPIGALLGEVEQVVNLPKDNKEAVCKVLETADNLMCDTVDEVTEEIKNQINLKRSGRQGVVSNLTDLWSDSEYRIFTNTLTLSKLGRGATNCTLKYMKAENETRPSPDNTILDTLAKNALRLSPALDDFVSSLYPPIEDNTLPSSLQKIVTSLNDFLDTFINFPGLTEAEKEVTDNIKKELKKCNDELKTLLVSNEILEIAHLEINQD